MSKVDKNGNYIGDGYWHVKPTIIDFTEDYPEITSTVNNSMSTESTYVYYENTNNEKQVVVRFSNHENNAVRFGDQLNGFTATKNEILYGLGVLNREFFPAKKLYINFRMAPKRDLIKFEESPLSIKEMYDLGAGADISNHKGKLARGSNYLIIGDKVEEIEEKRRDPFGRIVTVGGYNYVPNPEYIKTKKEVKMTAKSSNMVMIFNETDGIYAHPEPMTEAKAQQWVKNFVKNLKRTQGYYLTSEQVRIDPDELQFDLQPYEEGDPGTGMPDEYFREGGVVLDEITMDNHDRVTEGIRFSDMSQGIQDGHDFFVENRDLYGMDPEIDDVIHLYFKGLGKEIAAKKRSEIKPAPAPKLEPKPDTEDKAKDDPAPEPKPGPKSSALERKLQFLEKNASKTSDPDDLIALINHARNPEHSADQKKKIEALIDDYYKALRQAQKPVIEVAKTEPKKKIKREQPKPEEKKRIVRAKEKKAVVVKKIKRSIKVSDDRIKKFKRSSPEKYKRVTRNTKSVESDAARSAKKFGKRKSASGKTYYENRTNRGDSSSNRYPKLSRGGQPKQDILQQQIEAQRKIKNLHTAFLQSAESSEERKLAHENYVRAMQEYNKKFKTKKYGV